MPVFLNRKRWDTTTGSPVLFAVFRILFFHYVECVGISGLLRGIGEALVGDGSMDHNQGT